MDLRVGGTYHYGMEAPNGAAMWGLFKYREIVPQEKLVFVNSFSDEAGGVTRHPGSATWPLHMLSTFTFEDAPGGKTKFTVTLAHARRHGRRAEDLRRHARQHDARLGRHHGSARRVSGQDQVRRSGMITISAFRWVPDFARGQVRDLRVRWALEEAGLPYRTRLLEMGDQDKPDYRALQPFGQVPMLEEDGLVAFRVRAIVLHIGERCEALLPTDSARAQPRDAMAYCRAQLDRTARDQRAR